MSSVIGVVFDLDGTLADTALDFKAMRNELGFAADAPILETIATYPPDQQPALNAIVDRHEMLGAERATFMPGARELLDKLSLLGLKVGIFTRNSRRATAVAVQRLGLESIEHIITRDEAEPKPHPEGLLRIAEAWEAEPTEIVYIGDYLHDLNAGRAAGVKTLLYSPKPRDFEADPDFEFSSYAELSSRFEEHLVRDFASSNDSRDNQQSLECAQST